MNDQNVDVSGWKNWIKGTTLCLLSTHYCHLHYEMFWTTQNSVPRNLTENEKFDTTKNKSNNNMWREYMA